MGKMKVDYYFSLLNQYPMKKVTLYFPDVKDLRRFTQIVECSYMKMIVDNLTLTCDCGDAEIELAERGFSAKVVDFWPTGF